jgi:sugar phosphate isomerase/epimerase
MPEPRIAFSTVSFTSLAALETFRTGHEQAFGEGPLFELSYEWRLDSPDQAPGMRGAVVSVHAPCPRSMNFPNLGSRDPSVLRASLEDIRRSAETAAAFGAGFVVLHPGYALDVAVPVDSDRRLAALSRHAGDAARYIWSPGGRICTPGYCETAEYRLRREDTTARLVEAVRLCTAEGVALAVENLNPRVAYLFQTPAELVGLVHALPQLSLCVDLGHLWISSLVHGFDFVSGLRDMLATGRVVSAHVHDNGSQLGTRVADRVVEAPPDGSRFSDDHLALGRGNVPIAAAVRQLKRVGVGFLVVETLDPPLESARHLARMLGRAAPAIRERSRRSS